MKKIITLVLFIFLYQISFSQTWMLRDSFPGQGRSRAASFSIGDTCYVVAGGSNSAGYLKTCYAYDTLTNTWWQVANYPGNGSDGVVGFAINGKGYAGTGAVGGYQYYNDFWEYDPGTNTWTSIPSFPGQGRSFDVSFAVSGKGYVGGGLNGFNNNPLPDFWAYDPVANKWDSVATCPALGVGEQACGFSIGNKGYVGTGIDLNAGSSPEQDFWEYDPSKGHLGTWTQKANFPGAARAEAAGFGFCDKGYMGCGYSNVTGNPFYNDFYEFDPLKGPNGTWTQVVNYGGRVRCGLNVFVVGKSAFAGLGANYSTGANPLDFYEYHPIFIPAISSDSVICAGGTISFNDSSDYEPTNWQWNFPGGTPDTSTVQNPTVEYDTSGSWSVTLTAWNSCGDSGTKTFTSYVTVKTAPSLTIQPPSTSIACGTSITLSAPVSGSGYIWNPSSTLSSSTGDSVVATPTVTTTYTVTGNDSTGCLATGTDTISVTAAPPLTIEPLDTLFCSGQSATLYVSGSGSGFMWSPVTGLSADTGSFVVASPTVTSTYTVTGINSYGCADTGTDMVTVIPSPGTPTFTQSGDTLKSSAVHDNQWYRNDSLLMNDTSQYLITNISGEYWVVVTNEANGCSTASDSAFTGIQQLMSINNQLSIYPNPFTNDVFIKINSSVENVKSWNLQITDVLGRILYTMPSLNNSNEIDLSKISSGVYFITVINKTGRAVVPVVKQN